MRPFCVSMLMLLISAIPNRTIGAISEKVDSDICDPNHVHGQDSSDLRCTESDMFGNCSSTVEMGENSFIRNKKTGEEYREGDPIISSCPSRWRYFTLIHYKKIQSR